MGFFLSGNRKINTMMMMIDWSSGGGGHRARDNVAFLERETPDFIPPKMATEFAGP